MKVKFRHLSLEMIEASDQLQHWINQFRPEQRTTAIELLLKLRFVSRDTYSEWLKTKLSEIEPGICAVYAVSKIDDSYNYLWDENENTIRRPSHSLGSEDLVNSVIANFKRGNAWYLDHPGLPELRRLRVKNVVLIDDSMGSGQRVASYIGLAMNNRTFRSWWSFGWIQLHVIAFCTTAEGKQFIRRSTPGSDHAVRKFPRSKKIDFHGHYVLNQDLSERWGSQYHKILALCDSIESIPDSLRRGFGGTMSNIMFYHSVPDNLPGLLWFNSKAWRALLSDRSMPHWLPTLLDTKISERHWSVLTEESITLLHLVRRGIRNPNSLAWHMGLDCAVVREILARGRRDGLLTASNRLTKAGSDAVRENGQGRGEWFDRSLYIPNKWCVGQRTVQPFGKRGDSHEFQTDSTNGLPLVDGEVG